jgi:uncharacterized cupredoxin-like copper-binding protein
MAITRIPLLLSGLTVVVMGCTAGGGSPAPSGSSDAAPTTAGASASSSGGAGIAVDVQLQEWAVGTVPSSGPTGEYMFTVNNIGPEDAHEFVVIKTDLPLTDLPTDATGAVDEAGAGIQVVDEVEEIAVGSSGQLTVTLEPGAYVFICNIYDQTEQEAHYQLGMRTAFTVSG